MALPCARRYMTLSVVIVLACGSAGCPKLNRWPGPTQDPFFSIADPLPPAGPSSPSSDSSRLQNPARDSRKDLQESGKLLDNARRP